MKILSLATLLLAAASASAQLAVTVAPLKLTGSKAVVKLELKNTFAEKIESARAVVFLMDEQGKVVGQSVQWVVGGTKDRPALEPNKETIFNFVLPADKVTTTNLTAKVMFNRLILEGGKSLDINGNVHVQVSTIKPK